MQGLCHSTFLRCWVLWSMFYYECSLKMNFDAWHFSHTEKWKEVKVPNSLRSHGLYSPRNSPGENTGMGSHWGSSQPGIKPRSPTLQADSLPAEPQRKPKNTGVGSLSLLQWIFPTQESNRGLLHCRWILYQLSYQGRLTCIKSLNPHNNTRR